MTKNPHYTLSSGIIFGHLSFLFNILNNIFKLNKDIRIIC